MDLAYRLLVYFVAMVGPTLLFLGLMRALEWLRDDALLARIAESEDASPAVRHAAARAVEKPDRTSRTRSGVRAAARSVRAKPIRTDGGAPDSESVVCSTCGETNQTGATFCRECVGKLGR